MEQTYNSQHRTIQNVVKCPNNLLCYKKNHIGSDNTLECLSENPQECTQQVVNLDIFANALFVFSLVKTL
jgi:hypothetical protein